MNLDAFSREYPQTCLSAVLLNIKGIGPVPSFKNSKMLTRGKLITAPRKQRWMKQAQAIIESELLSSFPTSESAMVTAESLRSWIASSVPANDSCRYLIACSWHFMTVAKGEVGAMIVIERL